MIKVNHTCGTCCGLGIIKSWIPDDNLGKNGTRTAHMKQLICTACGGKGYTEYVMFTPEEAEQIMKVCGLSDEVRKQE